MGNNSSSKMSVMTSSSSSLKIGGTLVVSSALVVLLLKWRQQQQQQQQQQQVQPSASTDTTAPMMKPIIKILYGTVTGKAKQFARDFYDACCARGYASHTRLISMSDYDPDEQLFEDLNAAKQQQQQPQQTILVIFVSTYSEGTPPQSAAWFHKCVTEMSHDFRYESGVLAGLPYAICGLGNSLYEQHYNTVARQLADAFNKLHAQPLLPLALCDENTVKSEHGSLEADVAHWAAQMLVKLDTIVKHGTTADTNTACACSGGTNGGETTALCCKSNGEKKKPTVGGEAIENGENEEEEEEEEEEEDEGEEDEDTSNAEDDDDDESDADENGDEYVSDMDSVLHEEDEEAAAVDAGEVKEPQLGGVSMSKCLTVWCHLKEMERRSPSGRRRRAPAASWTWRTSAWCST